MLTEFGAGLLASCLGVYVAKSGAARLRLYDVPNERSSHQVPTPRTGGVGIAFGIVLAMLVSGQSGSLASPLCVGAVAVAVLGLIDDVVSLRSGIRFLMQGLICCAYVYVSEAPSRVLLPGGVQLDVAGFGPVLAVLWLMWMVNLYNFMDGLDGLAGTQALSVGLFFAFVCSGPLQALGTAIAGASAGFLVWNWPPARVFMGDAGSTMLGFLFAGMGLEADLQAEPIPLLASIIVLFPFIFDATLTLVRRAVRRARVWQAHRTHLYQLPQSWGVPNPQVMRIESILITIQLGLGLLYVREAETIVAWGAVALSALIAASLSTWVLRLAVTQRVLVSALERKDTP